VRSQLRPQEWMVTLPARSPTMSSDHSIGSRATQVTVTVAVTCQAEVYDQHAAKMLASISFTQETSAALGANYALVGQVTTTLTDVIVTDTKRGTLALSTLAEGVWLYQWSLAHLDTLVKQIAGMQKRKALTLLLREEGVQTASILVTGSERATLPADPSNIIITVTGEQTTEGETPVL
jgi:hypothetical protein